MNNFSTQCFVCQKKIDPSRVSKNKALNLPVCDQCKDSDEEKQMVNNLNDEMGDGFICGCI